jgi:uncharacterized membrane protein YsdA (DUF1294 family)
VVVFTSVDFYLQQLATLWLHELLFGTAGVKVASIRLEHKHKVGKATPALKNEGKLNHYTVFVTSDMTKHVYLY